ncbi:MAG: YgfZ/GcvT domain-containing protein [Thiohalospira sp.]
MNGDWQTFLSDQGAAFEAEAVTGFGGADGLEAAATEDDLTVPLTEFGIIEVTGGDAAEFLQNQLTNDVEHLPADGTRLAAWLNPKGRILVSFRVLPREGGGFLLLLPRERMEPVLKRLQMFVLRSDVTLNDVSDQGALIATAGPEAGRRVADLFGSAPGETDALARGGPGTVVRLPGPGERFLALVDAAGAPTAWQALAAGATAGSAAAWRLTEVRAGIPTITDATAEAFVPQMVNYHAISGVSFRKGCYPGQEVVARMQYLGKLKRRMYRARTEGEAAPAAGAEIHTPGREQPVGRVVQAAPLPDGGSELLAVLEIAVVDEALALEVEGQRLDLLELPYTVEAAER